MLEKRPPRQAVPHRSTRPVVARGLVRPIYAGVFDIDVRDFDSTAGAVRTWLRTHNTVGNLLAGTTSPFFSVNRIVEEGLLAEVAVSADSRLLAARLVHWEGADRTRGIAGDPTKRWRSEATVGRDDDTAWLAVRTWFTGLDTDRRPCMPPRFLRDFWENSVLSDGVNFGKQVWPVEFDEDIDLLVELIDDPQRDFPVVLIAEDAPLDAEAFGPKGVGVAHVCQVLETARIPLAQRLGPHRALYRRSVRTYYPLVAGHEMVAPGAAPWTIAEWRFGALAGAAAFADWLHEDLGRIVTRRMLNDPAHSSYEEVKAAAIEAERAILRAQDGGAATVRRERHLASEQNAMLQAQNENLQKTVQDQHDLALEYGLNDKQQQKDISDRDDEIRKLRAQVLTLRHALSAKGLPPHADLTNADIERLIAENSGQPDVAAAVETAGRILMEHAANVAFSDAAFEGAWDTPFVRPDEVLAALLRLGFYWNDVRAGTGAPLTERARERLGFWFAMRDSETTMNQFGGERRLTHNGVGLVLEKHLTLGGGPQNAQTTAQIYFGDKDGQLLIGHVGRHLTVVKTQ